MQKVNFYFNLFWRTSKFPLRFLFCLIPVLTLYLLLGDTVESVESKPSLVKRMAQKANKQGPAALSAAVTKESLIELTSTDYYIIGSKLIKSFESLFLYPYKCPAGVITVGWGYTYETKDGQLTAKGKQQLWADRNGITMAEAQKRFQIDLKESSDELNKFVRFRHPADHMSLISLMYNSGYKGSFKRGTAPAKWYALGMPIEQVADSLRSRFVKGTGYEAGIRARREMEALLMLCRSKSDYDELDALIEKRLAEDSKVLDLYGIPRIKGGRANELPKGRWRKSELSIKAIEALCK